MYAIIPAVFRASGKMSFLMSAQGNRRGLSDRLEPNPESKQVSIRESQPLFITYSHCLMIGTNALAFPASDPIVFRPSCVAAKIVYMSVCLSVCLSIHYMSVCLSVCLYICISVCLCVCVSIYLPVSQSVSVCLSVCLSICLFV